MKDYSKFETKYGFFSVDGKEYHIKTPRTPKPWVNVISNGSYGTVVSQTGGGFSWDNHSEFNRITRWHQDLVQDNWGKYIYLKNNKTGNIWSPTWMPVKQELDYYKCIHGMGYTIFQSELDNIKCVLKIFVPWESSLEIWDLEIINESKEEVDLSVFTYLEWVLGSSNDYHREFHKLFLETEYSEKINGITATKRLWDIPLENRGHWNIEYPYYGFLSTNHKIESYDAHKDSFIGQYGDTKLPESVLTGNMKENTGAFNDSIASLNLRLNIHGGKKENFAFYLGIGDSVEKIEEKLSYFQTKGQLAKALQNVKDNWSNLLGEMHVTTPDESLNICVNDWYRYQALSGRLWGRTAYYQQSGAYGFRDQLQDSLLFLPLKPELTLEQVKLHARHQKKDGTVLHWWHPISETGLETKMTDDLLWLPFIIIHYLFETGDYKCLQIQETFYDSLGEKETLFQHCILAIEAVLNRFSKRGLPLIGAGDWNDGLSAVGLEMKGESIWLAEFLYYILIEFSKICKIINEKETSEKYLAAAGKLKSSFNKHAWDGEWFYRATKDSGEKLGSKECSEGKIYLNPQTWSVISGIADAEKQKQAMDSVKKHLIKNNGPLLLYPAYYKPDKYIGYLSRYAAGKRENGGVYSHAATWAIWAFSLMKNAEDSYNVFQKLCSINSGMEPDKYVAEPYVMPGNIDGPDSPNYGMAGWTWYTGSASWFQKVIVDWILGIRATEKGLVIDPCIPKEWKNYSVTRKFRGNKFNIEVINNDGFTNGIKCVEINGAEYFSNLIYSGDKEVTNVKVFMGKPKGKFEYYK